MHLDRDPIPGEVIWFTYSSTDDFYDKYVNPYNWWCPKVEDHFCLAPKHYPNWYKTYFDDVPPEGMCGYFQSLNYLGTPGITQVIG